MIKETRVENGRLRGIRAADPRIISYKGIPYAAPPVGENRWRAPQPAQDWNGVLDCDRFGPISMALLVLLMAVVLALTTDSFLTGENISNILKQASITVVLACGMGLLYFLYYLQDKMPARA